MKAEYIDHMGDDLSVVNAARVSFSKMSEWEHTDHIFTLKESDAKLIRYLAKHNHWTPFAHTSITLRMTAPLPIRTQCFKHKQGFVENEESRRYISNKPQLFIPESFRMKPEGSIKQGSGGIHPNSPYWVEVYEFHCKEMISLYEDMIEAGVCPEQARLVLPQGVEVSWVWTGSLYAYANYYLKRTDPLAQVEGQALAKEVGEIISNLYPVSWAALTRPEVSTNG